MSGQDHNSNGQGPGPSAQLPQMEPRQALWRGTVTALVVVFPVGVLNQLLVDLGDVEPTSPVVMLLWLLILLGGAAGGWATIRLSQRAPLSYAAGAGAFAYLIVQAIGVVRRLIADVPISWIAYPMLALLMAVCGALGGQFARRWQSPTATATDQGSGGAAPSQRWTALQQNRGQENRGQQNRGQENKREKNRRKKDGAENTPGEDDR